MPDEIRDHLNVVRRLGYVRPSADHSRKLRAGRIDIQTLRTNLGLPPLVPAADWQPRDFVTGHPKEMILDQGSLGACTGFSCAGALARQRVIRGFPHVKLSGFWVYDQINGRRDDGSNIGDSRVTVENVGAPPEAVYNRCLFEPGAKPSGAQFYRESIACTVSTSETISAAIQMGFMVQCPVDGDFGSFTGEGIAYGGTAPRRPVANHSIYLAGEVVINGRKYFILVNSWDLWGPNGNGTCLISHEAIDATAEDDSYAHADNVEP